MVKLNCIYHSFENDGVNFIQKEFIMKSDKRCGIAVLGCGTVGGGTAKILVEDNDFLKRNSAYRHRPI